MNRDPLCWTRRNFIFATGASLLVPRLGYSAESLFSIRNSKGSKILNRSLFEKGFWDDASKKFYKNKNHDEIRLKSMDNGYLTYISGCGDADFPKEKVGEGIFWHQKELPNHMAGAVACDLLGHGSDPVLQKPFSDTFLLGDFDFFYAIYFQRMYKYVLPDGRIVLPFELIQANFLDATAWTKYNAAKERMIADTKKKRRGLLFGDVLDMKELYGMYVVSPGDKQESRVTMIARLRFGGDSWIADFGSKLPFVLRAGLANGFRAHVDIVKHVIAGKYKR